jgi:hypothetical protein
VRHPCWLVPRQLRRANLDAHGNDVGHPLPNRLDVHAGPSLVQRDVWAWIDMATAVGRVVGEGVGELGGEPPERLLVDR